MSTLRLSPALHEMSDLTLHARLRARILAARLDDQLADGCAPHASPELAWRAEHLRSARSRDVLALGLRRAVADARTPRRTLTAANSAAT